MWATLLGVVLGFSLSRIGDYIQTVKVERDTKESIKTLIQLEGRKNIEVLTRYWEAVEKQEDSWVSDRGEFRWVALGTASAIVVLPRFSSDCWSANLNRLPKAYKPFELSRLWAAYQNLERIYVLWQQLVQLEREQNSQADRAAMRNAVRGDAHPTIMSRLTIGLASRGNVAMVVKEFRELIEAEIGKDACRFK